MQALAEYMQWFPDPVVTYGSVCKQVGMLSSSNRINSLSFLCNHRFRHYIRGWLGWSNYLQEKETS